MTVSSYSVPSFGSVVVVEEEEVESEEVVSEEVVSEEVVSDEVVVPLLVESSVSVSVVEEVVVVSVAEEVPVVDEVEVVVVWQLAKRAKDVRTRKSFVFFINKPP